MTIGLFSDVGEDYDDNDDGYDDNDDGYDDMMVMMI